MYSYVRILTGGGRVAETPVPEPTGAETGEQHYSESEADDDYRIDVPGISTVGKPQPADSHTGESLDTSPLMRTQLR